MESAYEDNTSEGTNMTTPIIQIENETFDLLLTALHVCNLPTRCPYAIIVFGKSGGMNPEVIAYDQNEYESQSISTSPDSPTGWEDAEALAIFLRKTPPHIHEFRCACGEQW